MSEVFVGNKEEKTMMLTIRSSASDDPVISEIDSYRFYENEPKIFMVCEDCN